ncbi:hypothetical protein WA026_014179 [Henosepilachna vigintioctopunctata]|uniref:Uncharacterized protein n=1 Tax=Henosepilachna vigintioctopunctata TaxID=420089 RepID=A0AAW1TVH4_9CUCU
MDDGIEAKESFMYPTPIQGESRLVTQRGVISYVVTDITDEEIINSDSPIKILGARRLNGRYYGDAAQFFETENSSSNRPDFNSYPTLPASQRSDETSELVEVPNRRILIKSQLQIPYDEISASSPRKRKIPWSYPLDMTKKHIKCPQLTAHLLNMKEMDFF